MNEVLDAGWTKSKKIALIMGAFVVVAFIGLMNMRTTSAAIPLEKLGIPLPFGGSVDGSSNLKGLVTYYGKRNNIDVYEVTFDKGETRETFNPDRIYLVHIPSDPTIVNAPLDNVMKSLTTASHAVNYYGYKYSDAWATMERRDVYALRFTDRFPGKFFASKTARDDDYKHGNMLLAFERETGTTFLKTDATVGAPRIDNGGSLFVFVVNEPGGVFFGPRDKGTCGDMTVEGAEECDDGNTNNADMCKNDCTQGIPIPFGSGSSATGARLAITQQPLVATNTVILTDTGVNLFKFQASAGVEDIRLKKLVFTAATGSLSSVKNITLWKDTNNDNKVDTLVQTLPAPVGGVVAFSGSQTITKNQTITYEVHADVALAPAIFRLKLSTLTADYVAGDRVLVQLPLSGIRTDGVCSIAVCQTVVTTQNATLWTFLPQDPTRLRITMSTAAATGTLMTGSTGSVLSFASTAVSENIALKKLVFKAMTGSVQNMHFSLWADPEADGSFVRVNQDPVIDTVLRTVTFQHATSLHSISSGSTSTIELRAMPKASATGFFKAAFSISTAQYVDAFSATAQQALVGIKTNGFCAGVICEIIVTEKPTTLFSIPAPGGVCGNGTTEGGEECDAGSQNGQICTPPNGGSCTYCSSQCTNVTLHGSSSCGNGQREGTEECDDGNSVNTDACTNQCKNAACGDTFVQGTEQCDDGNITNGDGCSATCMNENTAVCGNGQIQGAEQCDDNNTTNGDGCSSSCVVESGFACTGQPSQCSVLSTVPFSLVVLPMASSGSTSPGETDLTFVRLRASAGSAAILVKGLMFHAATGSLADLTNLELWRDTNGDGTVDTKVLNQSTNSTATTLVFFSGSVVANRTINPFTSTIFEVRGDIVASVTPPKNVRLKLQTNLGNYVSALDISASSDLGGIETDGLCLFTCDIDVTTGPTTLWHILQGPVCGDGVVEGAEECDDGNQVNDDECDNTCHLTTPLPPF